MDTIILAELRSIYERYANTPALKHWIIAHNKFLSDIALIRIYKKHVIGMTLLLHMHERIYNHETHQIDSEEVIYRMDIYPDGSLMDVHVIHQDAIETYERAIRPNSSREFDLAQE